MPIYEYRCEKCGKVYEKLILTSSHKEVDVICDGCGVNCKKIISKSSFKVNGFNAENRYS